jgi:hypothetical protein
MKRSLTFLMMLLPLVLPEVAGARARARRSLKPQPKLLFTVEKVDSVQPAPLVLPGLRAALDKALAAEPLVITGLGLKKPTPARTAWELRRRRLRWFGVTARLETLSHRVVVKGGQKLLVAEATVSLSGTRKERRRKGTFAARSTGKVSTPVSVILHGEVLASRIAAARAAVALALKNAVTQLTAPKKRGHRR